MSRDYSHALTISSSSDEELRTSGHLTLLPGGIVDEPSDLSARLLIVRVAVRIFQQFTQCFDVAYTTKGLLANPIY